MVMYSLSMLFTEYVMAALAFLTGAAVIVWYTDSGEAEAEAESLGNWDLESVVLMGKLA